MKFGIKSITFSNFRKFENDVKVNFETNSTKYNFKHSIRTIESKNKTISLNSIIGLIGANATGKSTCIDLITKYLDFNRFGNQPRTVLTNRGFAQQVSIFNGTDMILNPLNIKVVYASERGDFIHELTFFNPIEFEEKITFGRKVLWNESTRLGNEFGFGQYFQVVTSTKTNLMKPKSITNEDLVFFGSKMLSVSSNYFNVQSMAEKKSLLTHMTNEFVLSDILKLNNIESLGKKIEFVLKSVDRRIKNVVLNIHDNAKDPFGRPTREIDPVITLVDGRKISFNHLSTGTIKFLNVVLVALRLENDNGDARYLFIDELDNSWHPSLTRFLIRLFKTSFFNNVYLIFTAHNPYIMEELRKDAIYMMDDDHVYPLSNLIWNGKPIRHDFKFAKNYFDEIIGSHPSESDLEKFVEDECLHENK